VLGSHDTLVIAGRAVLLSENFDQRVDDPHLLCRRRRSWPQTLVSRWKQQAGVALEAAEISTDIK
jgi:hypothetical protein